MATTLDAARPAVPLDQPLPGATLDQAVARFWRKYATFSGRASRSEFWFAILAANVPPAIAIIIAPMPLHLLPDDAFGVSMLILALLTYGYMLALIVPLLAVTWRRLHDVNSSGGLYFFGLIPLIGPILLLMNLAGASDPDGARFDRPGVTPGREA